MTNKMLTEIFEVYVHVVRHEGIKRLNDVYKSYSTAKSRAWYKVNNIQGAHSVTVLGHNCCFFSLGYLYMPKADSYEGMLFVYKTHRNTYRLELTPEQIVKVRGTASERSLVPTNALIGGTWTSIPVPDTCNED